MLTGRSNSTVRLSTRIALALAGLALLISPAAFAQKKTTKQAAPAAEAPKKVKMDNSKLVWPQPPYIARVKFDQFFVGLPFEATPEGQKAKKKKASWMDRLAGTQEKDQADILKTFPFQLIAPYGIAVDSHGLVYTADQRVGAIFIFNPKDKKHVQMIKNGADAHFGLVNGLAIDDTDRLFVSDGKMHRVLVMKAKYDGESVTHEVEGVIEAGLKDPVGVAIDTENRFLYVVDTQQDQVVVFDADTYKELRRIGRGGQNHYLTDPGDFAAPTNVALDKDGNVYVTDTLNNRVEIFDADGKFISWFGKHGDGPGYFARPKGIAVDSDGHIWVMDQYQDRLQVFDREGQLLTYIGGHGNYPGQFASGVGVAVDKWNHVYATDQYPGRLQMFQYVTDAEADAERAKRDAERDKKPKGAEPAAKETASNPTPEKAAQ